MAEVPVVLPSFGESMRDATMVEWLKQEGERVEREEPLCVVETDKVDAEVPSPEAGTVTAILVAPQERVDVGAPIARIETG
jgi:2-oxoglutarate dehydrogenase E2 component (dihydrolipoamide succinyltransferase)